MQTHNSKVSVGSRVTFPEWRGERHYMLPFTVDAGLPSGIGRFQQTVDQMMEGVLVNKNQECYIMVDEKEVFPNTFHRRPGLHVDGYWEPGIYCHGGQPTHVPIPRHVPLPRRHRGDSPRHRGCSSQDVNEGLLLASNYSAARAVLGEYNRDFTNDWRGGDCAELNVNNLPEIFLQANRCYHMDVMTLHESLPITESVRRTLVRINVPNWKN